MEISPHLYFCQFSSTEVETWSPVHSRQVICLRTNPVSYNFHLFIKNFGFRHHLCGVWWYKNVIPAQEAEAELAVSWRSVWYREPLYQKIKPSQKKQKLKRKQFFISFSINVKQIKLEMACFCSLFTY